MDMSVENAIRVLAGTLVLTSVALAQFISPWWLLLACFVGCNLIQSAFTGFCPAGILLGRFGLAQGSCCARPGDQA